MQAMLPTRRADRAAAGGALDPQEPDSAGTQVATLAQVGFLSRHLARPSPTMAITRSLLERRNQRIVSARSSEEGRLAMARNEDLIREELAKKLDLIQPGLELVKTNYPLPNAHGTRGFIDILARDRNHVFVVIEIKRSDKTAREALHEVMKYAELLVREKGIDISDIRAAIVSSHWNELLTPFSHFKRGWHGDIRGYVMDLANDGVTPIAIEEVVELSESPSKGLTPTHTILARREGMTSVDVDNGWRQASDLLRDVGADDLIGIELVHSKLGRVLYLIVGKILSDDPRTVTLEYLTDDAPDNAEGVHADYSLEYQALCYMAERLTDLTPHVAYPEKLAAFISYGSWTVVRILRAGVFARQENLYPSEQMLSRVMESAGQSQVQFKASSEPQNRHHWTRFLAGVEYSLVGADEWARVLRPWLEEAAILNPRRDVVFDIYNPCDLITTLVYGWPDTLTELTPALRAAVDAPQAEGGRLIHGILAWNGQAFRTCRTSFHLCILNLWTGV
jgi:hypothetical protein